MWAGIYAVSSIAIILFNKSVMSVWRFKNPMTLMFLQSVFTVVAVYSGVVPGIKPPQLTRATALRVAPLTIAFLAFVVLGLVGLGRTNVAMFLALRRLTILGVCSLQTALQGSSKAPTRASLGAIGVIILGAGIAAWKDLTFDPVSYGIIFLTNLTNALYLVFIAKVREDTGSSPLEVLVYNSVLAAPFLLVLGIATGETESVLAYPSWGDFGFLASLSFSAVLAGIMNLSAFESTAINSPTTQSVIGQLKNFITLLLSLALFDDYVFHPINFAGLMVSFAGGVLYGYIQLRAKMTGKTSARAAVADGRPADSNGGDARRALAASGAASPGSDGTPRRSHV